MKERKIRASNLFKRLWKDNAFREKMRLLNIGNTYNLGKNLSFVKIIHGNIYHIQKKELYNMLINYQSKKEFLEGLETR